MVSISLHIKKPVYTRLGCSKIPPFINAYLAEAGAYRARAATAARPIHPATSFPAPEVESEVEELAALEPEAVPVELAVELESEEVPVAVAVEDPLELLFVEEAVPWRTS